MPVRPDAFRGAVFHDRRCIDPAQDEFTKIGQLTDHTAGACAATAGD